MLNYPSESCITESPTKSGLPNYVNYEKKLSCSINKPVKQIYSSSNEYSYPNINIYDEITSYSSKKFNNDKTNYNKFLLDNQCDTSVSVAPSTIDSLSRVPSDKQNGLVSNRQKSLEHPSTSLPTKNYTCKKSTTTDKKIKNGKVLNEPFNDTTLYSSAFSTPSPVTSRSFFSRFFKKRFLCLGPRDGKDTTDQSTITFSNTCASFILPKEVQADFLPTETILTKSSICAASFINTSGSFLIEESLTKKTHIGLVRNNSEISIKKDSKDNFLDCLEESNNIDNISKPVVAAKNSYKSTGLNSIVTSAYQTPYNCDITLYWLSTLEERRQSYNAKQGKSIKQVKKNATNVFDRKVELLSFGDLLIDIAKGCMSEDIGKECVLAYEKEGLKVWKKEFGVNRLLVRACFVAPVSPQNYYEFASNPKYRQIWDKNIAEIHQVEDIGNGTDLCYTAYKRVATLFPRDSVNLRVRRKLEGSNSNMSSYASCSCSIEHPDYPEQQGRVRMDLRIAAYIATPFPTPFGMWSKIHSFNEGDPKGWIPSAVVKMLAAKVVPGSVEKLLSAMMKHYDIPIEGNCSISHSASKLKSVGIDWAADNSDNIFVDMNQ